MVTGQEFLTQLDDVIASLRTQVADAIATADQAAADDARLRDAQLQKYAALTEVRVDFLQQGGAATTLKRVHDKAAALLDQHDGFVAEAIAKLQKASEQVAAHEEERGRLAADHEKATDAYDERVREIETALGSDTAYQQLAVAHEAATAVVSRASEKLRLAQEDRRKKGEPYERDPLFFYLWKRQYKTPHYRAWSFFRMLDDWVARLCDYEDSYLNYQRLVELPERLADHVQAVEEKADLTLEVLEAAEENALAEGGAQVLEHSVKDLAERLAAQDETISEAEARYGELAAQQERALSEKEGPIVRARRMIEESLTAASLPSLRVMASETLTLEDDHLVDALVQLRAEEGIMAREARAASQHVSSQRKDLEAAQAFRRRLKGARLVSPYVTFRKGTVSDVLTRLERGGVSAQSAFDQMKRAARRSGPRTGGFGGRRRTRTMGVPEVLGDVMWEVAREAMRHGSGTNWGGYSTPRRRRTPVRMPRSSRGGGFKTGGGF